MAAGDTVHRVAGGASQEPGRQGANANVVAGGTAAGQLLCRGHGQLGACWAKGGLELRNGQNFVCEAGLRGRTHSLDQAQSYCPALVWQLASPGAVRGEFNYFAEDLGIADAYVFQSDHQEPVQEAGWFTPQDLGRRRRWLDRTTSYALLQRR